MHTSLYGSRELTELQAIDADEMRRLFICADSLSASAAPTINYTL